MTSQKKIQNLYKQPAEILIRMTEILPIIHVINLCKTNKYFNEVMCNNNVFWIKRLKQDFNITYTNDPDEAKEEYIQINKFFLSMTKLWNKLIEIKKEKKNTLTTNIKNDTKLTKAEINYY